MRLFLKIAATLVALALFVAAYVLVSAHIQVRCVSSPLPSSDELYRSVQSLNGPVDVRYIITSSQTLARGDISHISIIIEWANGKRFVIDTGMDAAQAEGFAKLMSKIDASAGEVTIYGTISELLGSSIVDVDGVGFTHLHIDHTQGISDFCKARGDGAVSLQTTSQKKLHNFNTAEGADLVSNSCLETGLFVVDSDDGLYHSDRFPGLVAYELGGHTPGSTLWAVGLGEKILLFSGDITNDKASIDDNRPKPAVYSYVLVPEDIKRTEQLRTWLKRLGDDERFSVIVSHDLKSTRLNLKEFISKESR